MKNLFPDAAPLLREIVNFGTNTFVRCLSAAQGAPNEDMAPFAIYRHVLEMTDSIEVLVSNGCAAAADPPLRSSFEALMSIEYILEPGAAYIARSLSWLAAHARRRLRSYRNLLGTSPEKSKFLKAILEDKTVVDFPPLPQEEIKAGIDRMEHLLAREQFNDIQAEFSRGKGEQEWFQLFDGPADRRELARHLGRTAQYDILYRRWSTSAHANDFFPFITRDRSGETAVRGLRDVASTNQVTTFATTFAIDATRALLGRFHPGETWGVWYMREIKDRYMAAANSSSESRVSSRADG